MCPSLSLIPPNLTAMKKTITLLFILVFIMILYVISPDTTSAQPSFPDNPEQIPVDGGLALLTAAGAGYALKNFRDKQKNKVS